jgi:hypothetical protein
MRRLSTFSRRGYAEIRQKNVLRQDLAPASGRRDRKIERDLCRIGLAKFRKFSLGRLAPSGEQRGEIGALTIRLLSGDLDSGDLWQAV